MYSPMTARFIGQSLFYFVMKVLYSISICLFLLCTLSCSNERKDPTVEIRSYIQAQMDSMQQQVLIMQSHVQSNKSSENIQQAFHTARKYYKHAEALNE